MPLRRCQSMCVACSPFLCCYIQGCLRFFYYLALFRVDASLSGEWFALFVCVSVYLSDFNIGHAQQRCHKCSVGDVVGALEMYWGYSPDHIVCVCVCASRSQLIFVHTPKHAPSAWYCIISEASTEMEYLVLDTYGRMYARSSADLSLECSAFFVCLWCEEHWRSVQSHNETASRHVHESIYFWIWTHSTHMHDNMRIFSERKQIRM